MFHTEQHVTAGTLLFPLISIEKHSTINEFH